MSILFLWLQVKVNLKLMGEVLFQGKEIWCFEFNQHIFIDL